MFAVVEKHWFDYDFFKVLAGRFLFCYSVFPDPDIIQVIRGYFLRSMSS